MKRRGFWPIGAFVLVLGLWLVRAPLLAAAVQVGGESVSYAVWNHTSTLNLVDVVVADNKGKVLAGGIGSRRPPIPADSGGWRGGGSAQPIDAKHYVPDSVSVSWRVSSDPASSESKGEVVGPIAVTLRSRIPDEVLRKVKASRRFYLEIGISAGVQPALLRWALIDTRPLMGEVGVREIQRGGDW
jgi:hypothetical protein